MDTRGLSCVWDAPEVNNSQRLRSVHPVPPCCSTHVFPEAAHAMDVIPSLLRQPLFLTRRPWTMAAAPRPALLKDTAAPAWGLLSLLATTFPHPISINFHLRSVCRLIWVGVSRNCHCAWVPNNAGWFVDGLALWAKGVGGLSRQQEALCLDIRKTSLPAIKGLGF